MIRLILFFLLMAGPVWAQDAVPANKLGKTVNTAGTVPLPSTVVPTGGIFIGDVAHFNSNNAAGTDQSNTFNILAPAGQLCFLQDIISAGTDAEVQIRRVVAAATALGSTVYATLTADGCIGLAGSGTRYYVNITTAPLAGDVMDVEVRGSSGNFWALSGDQTAIAPSDPTLDVNIGGGAFLVDVSTGNVTCGVAGCTYSSTRAAATGDSAVFCEGTDNAGDHCITMGAPASLNASSSCGWDADGAWLGECAYTTINNADTTGPGATENMTFADTGPPDTITTTTDFEAAGLAVTDRIVITGAANGGNNGQHRVTSISGTLITVGTNSSLVNEGPVSVTMVSAPVITLAAADMNGDMHIKLMAEPAYYNLPAAATGMNACFYDWWGGGTEAFITLDPDVGSSDQIWLDGAGVGVGDGIDSATPAAIGDSICLLAVDANNWITLNRVGTWVDGGPN
jgi:hypothetical protein